MQLKRVLVPVDFSASSRKAVDYAVSLARQFGAEILLLHVVQPIIMTPLTEAVVIGELWMSKFERKRPDSLPYGGGKSV
ncbi:MAG TPA: universal stress protein [Candidatus Acidoferrum sp.]|nr:universal stress protein [Candidatus Acidoferrum sp.]